MSTFSVLCLCNISITCHMVPCLLALLGQRYMMTSSIGSIFPRYWPFARGIHRSPVDSPHKGQWRGALMFSLICTCTWINGWVNNGEAGDLRSHRAHYDGIVMIRHRQPVIWKRLFFIVFTTVHTQCISFYSSYEHNIQDCHGDHTKILVYNPPPPSRKLLS